VRCPTWWSSTSRNASRHYARKCNGAARRDRLGFTATERVAEVSSSPTEVVQRVAMLEAEIASLRALLKRLKAEKISPGGRSGQPSAASRFNSGSRFRRPALIICLRPKLKGEDVMAKGYWIGDLFFDFESRCTCRICQAGGSAIAAAGGRFLARGTAAKAYERVSSSACGD